MHESCTLCVQGEPLQLVVPSTGIWGTAGIGGLNIDTSIPGQTETMTLPGVRLEDIVQEHVLLLKVSLLLKM